MNRGAFSLFSVQVSAMEPIAILAILAVVGWAVWKTGWAIRTLRQQRRDSESSGPGDGYRDGIGGIDPGGSSGHCGPGHGGDCGGHGGDSGGHGGW
jgi:hypothetical protein